MKLPAERRELVCVLDEDPDLAAEIDEPELLAARRHARAMVVSVEPPRWTASPLRDEARSGWLGFLLLDGLLLRRVGVGGRLACELFGPGDVVRPWDTDGEYDPLPISVDWVVLRAVRLAVLDTGFVKRVAPWPSINSQIVSRVARRARYLALTHAVTHLPRAHDRLLILFWLLAERWGKVTSRGVQVPLPATHEVLATLVGVHRPSVTIGLQRLARAGLLIREERDSWLLTDKAIESLRAPQLLRLGDDEEVEA